MVFLRMGHCFQVPSFASCAAGALPPSSGESFYLATSIACTRLREIPRNWIFRDSVPLGF